MKYLLPPALLLAALAAWIVWAAYDFHAMSSSWIWIRP